MISSPGANANADASTQVVAELNYRQYELAKWVVYLTAGVGMAALAGAAVLLLRAPKGWN